MDRIITYDTTLRDGAQGLGISFTVEDKSKSFKSSTNLALIIWKRAIRVQTPKILSSLNGQRICILIMRKLLHLEVQEE